MRQIPIQTQRTPTGEPLGIYQRYTVEKCDPSLDGSNDPHAVYFVLRLDAAGRDIEHLRACQQAALAYAQAIHNSKPRLARDLILLVAQHRAELEMRDLVEQYATILGSVEEKRS